MAGYTKLFSSILDSTVWQTPKHVRLTWITLLAMCDRDGVVEASVPGLAIRAGVERGECEQALAMFLAPDPDSRSSENEGRRIEKVDGGWRVLNHGKYAERLSHADKLEKAAERQRRFRERRAAKNNVTSNGDATTRNASVTRGDANNDMQMQIQIQMQTQTQKRESAHEAPEAPTVLPPDSPTSPSSLVHSLTLDCEVIRQAACRAYKAADVLQSRPLRDLGGKHWVALVAPLREVAMRDRVSLEEVADRLMAGFLASPRAKANHYPIPWLSENPAEFLSARAEPRADLDRLLAGIPRGAPQVFEPGSTVGNDFDVEIPTAKRAP